MTCSSPDVLRVGLVSISDRAAGGVYEDQNIPAMHDWLRHAIVGEVQVVTRLIPDERSLITHTLIELVDDAGCDLVLTSGGTGPAPRDVTPEATRDAGTRELPGFGEQMRQISLHFVPTAILSRQIAMIREVPQQHAQPAPHAALILNLPGQPKAIRETLEGLKDADGKPVVPGIFAAVPYCLDLIGGPYIETHAHVIAAFRPKSALRAS